MDKSIFISPEVRNLRDVLAETINISEEDIQRIKDEMRHRKIQKRIHDRKMSQHTDENKPR